MNDSRPKTPGVGSELGGLPSFGDRYLPVQKLAEGGMAEIFLARDATQPGRLVALKRILPAEAKNPEYLKMFHDEARIASGLSHPNVVRVHEVGRGPSGPFIVMEYLAGQDLYQLGRRARRSGSFLPWELVLAVGAQAADGVGYAHGLTGQGGAPLNIIHRDLTPSNVFVTWDGVVKVLDFGIAHAEKRLARTQAGLVKGKAQYLSPEQITGEAMDGRADQFALAAVLFELLTGRTMFSSDNELAALNAILEGVRPRVDAVRPDVPPGVDQVLQRATSKTPQARYPDMAAFGQALRAVLGRTPAREAVAQPLKQLFQQEFVAHAELMGRVSSGSTADLQRLVASPTVELPDEHHSASTDLIDTTATPRRRVPVVALALVVGLAAAVATFGLLSLRRPAPAAPPRTTLVLRTDPPGASISIDGARLASSTPVVLDTLSLGVHTVELTHPERRPWSGQVQLTAAQPTATIDTALPRPLGMLTVQVRPPGASVTVDGKALEVVDGVAASGAFSAGETHVLAASAEGYESTSRAVELRAEGTTAVTLSLLPERP
jgi:serine/threonine-protein kinase